jgi:ADP-heptose:LPS heptosyltransferase
MSGTKNILVIRLSAMGDVAMTVPLVRALAQQYPRVKVTVVSKPAFKSFFEEIPHVAFHGADVEGRHKGFFGLLKLYKELKAYHIYAVADLHNVLRSKIITARFRFNGKKTATTDKARDEKKALTRPKDKVFAQLTPVMQRHAEVFEKLGFPLKLDASVFPEKHSLTLDITELTGPKTGAWIGIAPFAQHQDKVYPSSLMQEVIRKLAAKNNYKIILFGGGKDETAQLKKYAKGHDNVVVVAGRLRLKQEIRLMEHLDLMVSMDSGNGHMAAMQGIPVITLWGATHPYAGYAPFMQPLENALVADREKYPLLPTSIYGNKKVKGYEDAMRTIRPEEVVNKIEEVLKR